MKTLLALLCSLFVGGCTLIGICVVSIAVWNYISNRIWKGVISKETRLIKR